ncbi:oligosaccharide repeat unit polymerase [Collimonas sp. OK242]|uniref:O-antigen polymerase n=1 Tax=Collimonas sp. OK242 TaxID=1798195 RepID=UPI0008986A8C|nr:O-antigen polymerase [Collimonas sp. OK242]SDX50687.1 oligosaccharide repeat unit polymerase [Collimonas sp. OK242]
MPALLLYKIMQKRKTSDWLINPIFIFSFLWATQIFGHIIFSGDFYPFVADTWIIIFGGFCAFIVGCITTKIFREKNAHVNSEYKDYVPRFVNLYIKILLPIYILFVAMPQIVNYALNSGQLLSEVRSSLVDSVVDNDRSVILVLYLHYLVVIASLLALSYASKFRKIIVIYIVISGVVAGLLTFGRTILMLYFISLSIILYFQARIGKKTVFIFGFSFLIIFFLIAYLLGKGGADNTLFESVAWNFKVYALSAVAAFNNYVAVGDPNIPGWLLVPNFLKSILGFIGINSDVTPTVLPFVETPLPTNVYTAFFPWYHDGGILGVLFGFFAIGFISMYLFRMRYKSKLNLLNYALSLYPLIMTIFEEQYLRTYTLWTLVFLLYIFFFAFENFKFKRI